MIREWLRRRREKREKHDALWAPFKTAGPDGLNALQNQFETSLRMRLGPAAIIEREIEHDCDGKDVLWLTVQPKNVKVAVSEGLIQVGERDFYEEWDGTPTEIIERACESVAAIMRDT